MNIIIINEYKNHGGTEVYVKNLKEILSRNGYVVKCIYLCANEDLTQDEYSLGFEESNIAKYILSYKHIRRIKKILNMLKPDVIIVNNVFSEPLTLYEAIKKFKVIQIIHDYQIVCPKSTCIKNNGAVCMGYANESCMFDCEYHSSKFALIAKLLLMKLVNNFRKSAIDIFIVPSKKLADISMLNGVKKVKVLPNPLLFDVVGEEIKPNSNKFVYVGSLNRNKGLYELLPAFKKFARNKDVSLHIYGRPTTREDEQFLNENCSSNIVFHGYVNNVDISKVLNDAYAILVPSLCMDNYPTTILEGFANRVLVIGSNRGGIPEMLEDNRGICYSYGEAGLLCALEKSKQLCSEEYLSITRAGVDYLNKNNRPDVYCDRLRKIIEGII